MSRARTLADLGAVTSSPTELNYSTNVTSDIQAQLNTKATTAYVDTAVGNVDLSTKASLSGATFTGDVAITGGGTLDVYNSGNTSTDLTALLGADNGSGYGRTNSTTKVAVIGMPHYTNAEEAVGLIVAGSLSNESFVTIGGGTSSVNAATHVSFNTASNINTTGGSERMRIDSSGNVGIGTTSSSVPLHVYGASSGDYLTKFEATTPYGVKIKTSGTSSSHEQFVIDNGNNSQIFKITGGGETFLSSNLYLGGSIQAASNSHGTSGQVLTSAGQNSLPTWADAGGSAGLTLVGSATMTNATTNSFTMSNVFSTTYRNYLMLIENFNVALNANGSGTICDLYMYLEDAAGVQDGGHPFNSEYFRTTQTGNTNYVDSSNSDELIRVQLRPLDNNNPNCFHFHITTSTIANSHRFVMLGQYFKEAQKIYTVGGGTKDDYTGTPTGINFKILQSSNYFANGSTVRIYGYTAS